MTIVKPHQAEYHSIMLNDERRLSAFRQAIEHAVDHHSICVDIGTGTGILAALAAKKARKVYGLEYFTQTAEFARKLLDNTKLASAITIVNESSYKFKLDDQPSVLISETIGSLGPEENIVEIFWDFCRRHPSIKSLIPMSLTIFAQPIFAVSIGATKERYLKGYKRLQDLGLNLDALQNGLDEDFCSQLRVLELEEQISQHPPTELIRYDLGKSSRSDFSRTITFKGLSNWNAIHLYFVCELYDKLKISSSINEPHTHWPRLFVARYQNKNKFNISYSSATRQFSFSWEDS